MPRSIDEITVNKKVKELRNEAIEMMRLTKEPFIRDGMELSITAVRNGGRKQDCIEYISRCEGLLTSQSSEVQVVEDPIKEVQIEEVQVVEDPIKEVQIEEVQVVEDPIKEVQIEEVQVVEDPIKEVQIEEVQVVEDPIKEVQIEEVDDDGLGLILESDIKDIATYIYLGKFSLSENKWEFPGLREYCVKLWRDNLPFSDEFIALVIEFSNKIEELYWNRNRHNTEINPGTITNYKVAVLKEIKKMVSHDNESFPDNLLAKTYAQFYGSVQRAFSRYTIAKNEKTTENLNNRSNNAIDIECEGLIGWAVLRLKHLPEDTSAWKQVAIAVMILTGRRQSEVMSSGKFQYIATDKVVFAGQLKRHKTEIVEPFQIPVLGNSAKEVVDAIAWLDSHGKRTIPKDDSFEEQQIAAKKSHDRHSRYLSEAAKKVCSGHIKVNDAKDWFLGTKDRRKCHLFRQIYGQISYPVFFEGSGRKLKQVLNEIMGHNKSDKKRKSADENYDADVFVKDIEEIKLLCE